MSTGEGDDVGRGPVVQRGSGTQSVMPCAAQDRETQPYSRAGRRDAYQNNYRGENVITDMQTQKRSDTRCTNALSQTHLKKTNSHGYECDREYERGRTTKLKHKQEQKVRHKGLAHPRGLCPVSWGHPSSPLSLNPSRNNFSTNTRTQTEHM